MNALGQSVLYVHPDALIAIDPPDNRVRAIFPVDLRVGGDGFAYVSSSPTLDFSMGQGSTMIKAAESFAAMFSTHAYYHFRDRGNLDDYLSKEGWTKGTIEHRDIAARIDALRQRIHGELYQTSVEISFVPGRLDDMYTIQVDNLDPTGVTTRRMKEEMS